MRLQEIPSETKAEIAGLENARNWIFQVNVNSLTDPQRKEVERRRKDFGYYSQREPARSRPDLQEALKLTGPEASLLRMTQEYAGIAGKLESELLSGGDPTRVLRIAMYLQGNLEGFLNDDPEHRSHLGGQWKVDTNIQVAYRILGADSRNVYDPQSLMFYDAPGSPAREMLNPFIARLRPSLSKSLTRLQEIIARTQSNRNPDVQRAGEAAARMQKRLHELSSILRDTEEYGRLIQREQGGRLNPEEKSRKEALEKKERFTHLGLRQETLDRFKNMVNSPEFRQDLAYLRQHLPKLQNATVEALRVGVRASEFEKRNQELAKHYGELERFFGSGGQLDGIIKALNAFDANTTWNRFVDWMKTNGVIIGIAVASTIAVLSVVGAPAGGAGFTAIAAHFAATTVVGGVAATVGTELGKEVVALYDPRFQSNIIRESLRGEIRPETLEQFGWDAGRNIVLMGGIGVAGRVAGSVVGRTAASNSALLNRIGAAQFSQSVMRLNRFTGRVTGEGTRSATVRGAGQCLKRWTWIPPRR